MHGFLATINRSGATSRIGAWQRDARIAIVCACGRVRTHVIRDLARGMPPTFQLEHMVEDILARCETRPGACEVELVSPDDGCAMEG